MSNLSVKTALVAGAWCPRTLESLTRSDGYPGSAYEVVTVQLSYSTTQMYE